MEKDSSKKRSYNDDPKQNDFSRISKFQKNLNP